MAQGVKTLFTISKKLQESFRFISYYAVRYLAKSSKFKANYMEEYRRVTGKLKKDRKKDRMKQKEKYKHEREKMKLEMLRMKEKRDRGREGERDGDRDEYKSRDRSVYPEGRRDRYRQSVGSLHRENERRDRQNERRDQHNEQNRRNKYSSQRRTLRSRQPQRQHRHSRSIDHQQQQKQRLRQKIRERSRSYFQDDNIEPTPQEQRQTAKKYDLYKSYEQQPNHKAPRIDNGQHKHHQQPQRVRTAPTAKQKWSEIQVQHYGSIDPDKYKILKVNEDQSDFQAENAVLKVPDIKPRQPLTPYFLFLRDKRYVISQSYPQLKEAQLSETLAKVWKNLPEPDKNPYIQQYTRARILYDHKLAIYYAIHPEFKDQMQGELERIQQAVKTNSDKKKDKKTKKGANEPKRNQKQKDNDGQ